MIGRISPPLTDAMDKVTRRLTQGLFHATRRAAQPRGDTKTLRQRLRQAHGLPGDEGGHWRWKISPRRSPGSATCKAHLEFC